jgi:ParB family transcriptional regulator, chromosome partitioning protein
MAASAEISAVDPNSIRPNPQNPRRFFNEESLDILRTSIQEVGILVPLIVFEDPSAPGEYVLLDGERRWTCAKDLGLTSVPVNTIPPPTSLENLLRMFNIHAVREEWPLISIALSLQQVIRESGETGEKRLAEITGLERGTVRRAKKLLGLPLEELALIRSEAHLDRAKQIHREDLYIEVIDAEASIRRHLPELAEEYGRDTIVRQFVRKREEGALRAITDFRAVPQLLRAVEREEVSRTRARNAVRRVIENVDVNPKTAADQVSAGAFERASLNRRVTAVIDALEAFETGEFAASVAPDDDTRATLLRLRSAVDRVLRRHG